VTAETKSNGITFKSQLSSDSKNLPKATFTPKYKWEDKNLEFEAKLTSNNTLNVKQTFSEVIPGLKLSLTGDRDLNKDDSAKFNDSVTASVEYSHELFHLAADGKLSSQGGEPWGPSFSGSLSTQPVENVNVGVKATHDDKESKLIGTLAGGIPEAQGAFTFSYPDAVYGAHFWHQCSPKFTYAASVSVPPVPEKPKKDDKKAPVPSVDLVGNYVIDDSTSLKAKLRTEVDREAGDHGFRAILALAQKVNSSTTVTVGADLNLNNALGLGFGSKKARVGDSSTFGVEVAFK